MSVPTAINLNDSTPPAPAGYRNAQWLADTNNPRNTSTHREATGSATAKTGNYTAVAADCGQILSFSAAAILTLPNPPPFGAWVIFVQNVSGGNLTVNPNGLNLDGQGTPLILGTNQGLYLATDGTNYFSERGQGILLDTNSVPNANQGELNVNDTVPAPPPGRTNIHWQSDPAPTGKVSGYMPAATAAAEGALLLAQDLGGTADLPKVTGLQTIPVRAGTPNNGDLLTYIQADAEWEPVSLANNPNLNTALGGPTGPLASFLSGTRYGQVPRGNVDGSNRTFALDYKLLTPYTILMLRDQVLNPGIQGDPSSLSATMGVPNAQYAVSGNVLTLGTAPQPGDFFYIWYDRGLQISAATSVTFNFISAYTVDPAAGTPTLFVGTAGSSGIFAANNSFYNGGSVSYSLKTTSVDVTNVNNHLGEPLKSVQGLLDLSVWFFLEGGNSSGGYHTWFDLYDVSVNVLYADGSTQRFVPTAASLWNVGNANQSTLQNPPGGGGSPPYYEDAYAVDGDPATFARFEARNWGTGLGYFSNNALLVSSFILASGTPPPSASNPPLGQTSTSTASNTQLTVANGGGLVSVNAAAGSTVTLPAQVNAPAAPTLGQTSGGSLAAATYYVTVAYTNGNGQSVASAVSSQAVSTSNVLTVASPAAATGATGYNVYVSTSASTPGTLQNVQPLAIGTGWTMPTSGAIAGTTYAPTVSTASPANGWSTTVANSGTSSVSLVPPSGATLNGGTSAVAIAPGQSGTLYANGSGGYNFLAAGGVSSVAGRTGAVTLAASDISGLAASATTDTTNASNISSGMLAVARGGTGTATPALVAGAGITVSGSWPNQTVALGTRQGFLSYYLAGKPGIGATAYATIPSNLTSFQIPAGFTGATARIGANPTSSATYTFYKNGASFGTLVISTSGGFTWSTGGSAISFTPGTDELSWSAPNPADTTLSDVRFGIPILIL